MFSYAFALADKVNIRPFSFRSVKRLTIADSSFIGSLASGTGTPADGFGTGVGLAIQDSETVAVERNVFRQWHRGALFHETGDLIVRGNDVSELRSDGMNFAQVERVLIERNHFHDFKGQIGGTDHPDMIQFWTNKTTAPSVGITIRDNILDRGAGSWTQSIFMRNEEVDNKRAGREMFYRDVTITGNVIRNSHLHGITVGETAGLVIANNTLIQAEASPRPLHVTVPGINVTLASENVRIENNIAPRFTENAGKSKGFVEIGGTIRDGWAIANNLRVQRNFPRAKDFYTNIFVDALAEGAVPLQKLQRLPSEVSPGHGDVGAPQSHFDPKPAAATVIILSSPEPGSGVRASGSMPRWSSDRPARSIRAGPAQSGISGTASASREWWLHTGS